MKKLIILALCVILFCGLFAGCNRSDTQDIITADILKPQEKEAVTSTINDYKPDEGYNFNISSKSSDIVGDMYDLTAETSSTVVGNIFVSSEFGNTVEIDINVKDCNDRDLESAINMAVNAVSAVYPDFNPDNYKDFPLNFDAVKNLIKKDEHQSNCIYSDNVDKSISFEFYPEDGLLTFMVTY